MMVAGRMMAMLVALAGFGRAQPLSEGERQPTPVTPGTRDLSPLAEPLSIEPVSLEVEVGFRRVYEVRDTRGRFGRRGERVYMRMSGGVRAIFPRSSYVETPAGDIAAVPNDTVWYIGDLPRELVSTPEAGAPGPLWADLSASRSAAAPSVERATETAPSEVAPASVFVPSLWTDTEYREQRLGALLDRALGRSRE